MFHLFTVTLISRRAPVAQVRSWEFPRGNLAIERVIGNGAFGVVSKAYAKGLPEKPEWTVVAVKSLQGNLLGSIRPIFSSSSLHFQQIAEKTMTVLI